MKILTPVLMSFALLTIGCSAGTPPETSAQESATPMTKAAAPAIITMTSPYSFDETIARVSAAIEKRPLNLFAKVDHAAGRGQN